MFTYLNPTVRKKLVDTGKLFRIDRGGRKLDGEPDDDGVVVNVLGPIPLPIQLGGVQCVAKWYATVRSTELQQVQTLADSLREQGGQNLFATLATSMAVNSVLMVGDPARHDAPLVRVHSNCLTGDVFGSERCECGPQLTEAVRRMADDASGGMIVYMAGHEGRGIGLWAKAATYLLQDAGEDTYQANESLGLPADSRDFTDAAALILHFLGNRPLRILTNNPKKLEDLEKSGLTQLEPISHVIGVSAHNKRYLSAKKVWGHRIDIDDLE